METTVAMPSSGNIPFSKQGETSLDEMNLSISIYILLIIIIILLYFHLTRNFNHWRNKNVPYVKPIPIFGNVLNVFLLKRSIGEFVGDLYRTTKSPYLGFFVFDQPFLLIRDPELIKLVFIKDFDHFNDRSVIENRPDDKLGSDILFILKNPVWRTVRMKVTPVFATGKMKNMLYLMVEATNDLIDYLTEVSLTQTTTEARETCMKYTTDVIASCAFGINAESFKHKNAEFRVVTKRVFEWNFSRAVQMASYFFAPVLVKLFKMKFIDSFAGQFMKDVFTKTMNERESSGGYRGDLIDILIQIRKQGDNLDYKLDGDKLVAQAVQFFVAGFETTGSTISFTLYELSLNKSIQDRLRTEIKTVLHKYGKISYEAIQEMKYLDMTVNETLRKYPVLPYLDRRCTKAYRIPDTDIVIEKGIPIYISLFGLHFDPEYFPEPERYDPERFSEENKGSIPACTYMPFGEGLHNCIGARFGLLSAKVGLIRILDNFKVELTEDSPVPLKFDPKGFLLAPENGLNLRFKLYNH